MSEHSCTQVLFGASAPLGLIAARLRKYGAEHIVAMTHGHEVWWARVPAARQLLRRIGNDVDALTYVSEWCRMHIASALSPATVSRMRPLSPGVDSKRFRPAEDKSTLRAELGLPREGPVVVCVARLVRRKGQDLLIRAMPELLRRHPGTTLVLVGGGPDRRRLARLAGRNHVSRSVLFTGGVPWDEVPMIMASADVFAMPCRTRLWGLEPEAFGIVFLEAQASGVPVIIGRSGGAPETLVTAEAGLVVDARVATVVEAVSRLLEAPPTAAATADFVERVHRSHDLSLVAQRLCAVLDERR
jgi:phosphatidylinositol alpha-1,6-mannosyltransferase